jgi:Uma2 family endonuclease
MNAERSQHWEMKLALAFAMREAIKTARIEAHVAAEGPTVKIPPGNRGVEPDVLVYLGPKVGRNELVVPEPIIVCEVLSPSTAKHDLSAKLEGYFALPSIQHYLIADPDKPLLIHHRRGTGDVIETRIISGPRLHLDPPGLDLDLAEVLGG